MPETFTRWDAANYLKTEEDARLYLASCAEEDPGDGSLIRIALADVARSGLAGGLAREADITNGALRESQPDDSAPSFASVMRIFSSLGLRVRLTE